MVTSDGSHASGQGTPPFDENAWETYLSAFKAELQDIKQVAWARFKGCGYTIDRMRIEHGPNAEVKTVMEEFNKWWAEMKPQVNGYETKVRELELPSIELVRMERMAQGLSV